MRKQTAMSTTSWDYKLEPLSDSELEEWLLFKNDVKKENNNSPLLKSNRCETAEQVLQNIEDLGKRENNYWLDEFPLFEEIQSLTSFDDSKPEFQIKLQDFPLNSNQIFLNQSWCGANFFELPSSTPDLLETNLEKSLDIYDVIPKDNDLYIDAFFNSPNSEPEGLKDFQNHEQESTSNDCDEEKYPDAENTITTSSKEQIVEVDEMLRTTALDLDQWESDSSRSDVSSIVASEASPKMREEDYNDPEWRPEEALKISGTRKSQGKRSKFYWRGGSQEDKKLRKKEQNKNAATRYRQKKKAQVSEILKEEKELKEKKAKLQEKAVDIQNEIKYLKGLMRDLFAAKGIIK